jgi:membrane protease YdiL (CAAX protease family)
MACEQGFRLEPLTSQLLGIPLIAAFQLLIARRPLAQLWAFDAEKFRLDRRTVAMAGVLVLGGGALLSLGNWPGAGLNGRVGLFALVCIAAMPAAFALRRQHADNLRRALPMLLVALVLRVGWFALWHPDRAMVISKAGMLDFFTIWACEFVGLFLVDEVAFRGTLDPYLTGAANGRLHAWCSAVFASILWALWHLPAYNPDAKTFVALFSGISPFSISLVVLGVLLSFAARSARTLVPSAALHAFGNAYVLTMLK